MDEKRIFEALRKTWDYIGDDVLKNCGGKVDRDVVIETAVDRVDMFDKEVSKEVMKLSWDEVKELGKKVFPFKYYVD